ncbi:MAG: hypothetical protein IPN69_24495 [Acidobacteria bacterium]|nr:hypothetical protein [Acidobacteriota bacterium]MBK8813870.1 hypothetical protein [Acidobacteriota bacterium]
MTANRSGIRNAIVVLTDQSGAIRTARTGSFGYYRFDDIEAGQTVIVNVRSKLYQFAPQVVWVNDSIADLDLLPLERNVSR